MKILIASFILSLAGGGFNLYAQHEARIIKFDEFENRIADSKKEVTVINFWATWCAPCIKELPYFEKAFQQHNGKMDLVLVNLDFAEKIEKVNEFIGKKSLKGEVLLLDEIDYNSWIDRVDPSWSGAIPATLFINQSTGERKFVEGELSGEELNTILNDFLL